MHLSDECNLPGIALRTVIEELATKNIEISTIKAALQDGRLIEVEDIFKIEDMN